MKLKLFFHDRCFDGTASAALFGRFYRDAIAPARVEPVGLRHRDGDPFEGVAFDGDDHACVDFRFSADPALRWWFDHHRTAFQPPALRGVFDARRSPTHWFDPEAASCAGLVARAVATGWGWTPPAPLAEAVAWAEVIDAAAFASAEEAASLASPAQRLAAFLGEAPDPDVTRYVDALGDGATLAELDAAPWVRATLDPLLAAREALRARLGARGEVHGDVVVFDLLDEAGLGAPGFVAYALFPRARYTVAASRGHGAIKIAVGYNPWCGVARGHDIGAICQAHGGGGHAVVGGVTLEPGETERARGAVAAIVAALRG
jgi:hypothetical protein